MASSIFKQRGDTLANWLRVDPVLHEREVVLVATDSAKTDEYDCRKVGDGKRKFSELPLLGYDCLPATGTSATQPMSQKATTDAIKAQDTKLNDLKRSVDEKTLTVDADILALQNAVWPLDVAFAVAPSVVKADTQTTVALSWSARRKGGDVTAQAAVELDGSLVSGNTKNVAVTVAHAGTRQFALKVSFEGLIVTRTCTVRGTLPTYFGTVSGTWAANEAAIKALTELTVGSRALSRTGIALNDGKIALAYPKDFGVLASVKDGNGYEVLSSYTRSEIRVNGNDYYCYLLTVPVTATGVTQIYS